MNILNTKVGHTVFGEGLVIGQETDRITVRFSEKHGTKKFEYPNAFGQYLKVFDASLESMIMGELQSKLSRKSDEKEARRQKYEENIVNEKMQLATEKKKETKKKKAAAQTI